jgi:glyoxylase-like metal-dependent hydrolase (beta-lactamase superfamily II)
MRQITRGVWALEGLKLGRSYLVEHAGSPGRAQNALTLIDTSSPGAVDGILRAIERVGRKPDDLRTIVATHYHFDHTGNVAALRERTGAQLVAGADDVPFIDGRTPWGTGRPPGALDRLSERFVAPRPFALTVDRALHDGDELDGGLRVLHAPGHTPGHIALHDLARGVLFAGDAFMNILGLRLPTAGATHDMEQARRSVEMLSLLEFDHALPGHGAPILSHAAEKLRSWHARWLRQSS